MSKNILVIDDEEIIVKSLTKLLEKNGFIVYVAKNGQDASIMVEEEEFDLIIADIRMPGLNGVETVKNIYAYFQENKMDEIPVIFITGYADDVVEAEAKKLNPVAYIHKPFDIKNLLETVKGVLEG